MKTRLIAAACMLSLSASSVAGVYVPPKPPPPPTGCSGCGGGGGGGGGW